MVGYVNQVSIAKNETLELFLYTEADNYTAWCPKRVTVQEAKKVGFNIGVTPFLLGKPVAILEITTEKSIYHVEAPYTVSVEEYNVF